MPILDKFIDEKALAVAAAVELRKLLEEGLTCKIQVGGTTLIAEFYLRGVE